MPLPAGVETVTVSSGEPLTLPDGTVMHGRLIATGPDLVTIGEDDVILGGTVEVPLVDGEFSVTLCSTDATGMSPTGWTYKVRGEFSNAPGWVRYISLPKASPAVKLADVIVPDPVAGEYSVLVDPSTLLDTLTPAAIGAVASAAVGVASGVASLDATGVVPIAQLPAGLYAPTLRLPRYVQPAQVITTFQSGHGWTNNAGSTLTNDATDYISGSQAAKLTTGGAGAAANLSRTGMPSFSAAGKIPRFRVKIGDIAHMAGLNFYLGSSGLSANFKWTVQGGPAGSNFVTSGDWVTITLPWADATTTGSPNRAALTDARIQVTDDATGNPVTLHAQSVELIPDSSGPLSAIGGRVACFGFDDCWESLQLAKAVMDTYGWPGSCYVITDILANPQSVVQPNAGARLTLAELRMMQNSYGWEIGAHAYRDEDHALSYTGMTAAQLRDDLERQKSWLNDNGFRGSSGCAYPLGQHGRTTDGQSTEDIVGDFFAYGRTTFNKIVESFPPAMPYRLRATSSISTASGGYAPSSLTATNTGRIDQVAANGGMLILVFHKIVTGTPASTTECALSDFQAICAKIASAGIPVMPLGDVLAYYG